MNYEINCSSTEVLKAAAMKLDAVVRMTSDAATKSAAAAELKELREELMARIEF